MSDPDHLEDTQFIETSPENAARRAITFCLGRITERYGSGSPDELPFHTREHSELVSAFGTEILEIIKEEDPSLVSDEDILHYQIAASAHDIVQNAKKLPNKEGRIMRERTRGWKDVEGNEKKAALELKSHLDKYQYPDKSPVFPKAAEISDSIGTTFPEFAMAEFGAAEQRIIEDTLMDELGAELWDELKTKKHLCISQPEVTPNSSLGALTLGQADLRMALCHGVHFIDSGNSEFREINLWVADELNKGVENIDQQSRTAIAGEIIKWMRMQVGVALWQTVLFFQNWENNQILNSSPRAREIKDRIRQKYLPTIRQNIQAVVARYHQLENIDVKNIDQAQFINLVQQIGY